MESDEKMILLESIGKLRTDMMELPAGSEELKKQTDAVCKLLEQYNAIEKMELEALKNSAANLTATEELRVKREINKTEKIIKAVEVALKVSGTALAGWFVLKVVLIILEYEKDGVVRSKMLNFILRLMKVPVM